MHLRIPKSLVQSVSVYCCYITVGMSRGPAKTNLFNITLFISSINTLYATLQVRYFSEVIKKVEKLKTVRILTYMARN